MNRMIVAVLILLLTATSALATAQYPDKILYEGKEYDLVTNPMEPYFEKHPDLRPEEGSTALWRCYVATFAITNRTLVVTDIEIEGDLKEVNGIYHETWESVKKDVLPGVEQLIVDWFTGILVLPDGKLVNEVNMGYGSTYSNYILLEIKNGKLTGKRTYDYRQYEQFKEKQFQAFKKTKKYKMLLKELRKEGDSKEFIDTFLRSAVVEYSSEFLEEDSNKKSSNK